MLSDNSAMSGGGIYHLGSAITLTNTTLSGNTAEVGGGILLMGESTLTNVTLNGNSASDGGGGIFIAGKTATLTNVTLSGNSAGNHGGGISYSNISPISSIVTLTNSTLSGNWADSEGGGIYFGPSYYTHLTLINSIVANSSSGGNCYGGAADEAYFSLWSDSSCTYDIGTGNQPNTDPLLGPLADNGGPTLTHMLLPGSPAIDAGTADGAPITDQRGLPRPIGLAHDIGAVEVQFTSYLPVVIKP